MTCHQILWYLVPTTTAETTERSFPKGNLYMTITQTLGPIFTNPDFADLYVHRGRPCLPVSSRPAAERAAGSA